MTTSRRALLGAAWAVPVIAAAVAVPAVSATTDPSRTCGGTSGDNGTYTVTGNVLTISYTRAPDIYEINARGVGWSKSYGTNYGTAPARGSLSWSVVLPGEPTWVQAHTFDTHYPEGCSA
ncbi:hypothetical protein [Leucobacter chromiisoli]|uniref:hypothetical protein n=1 Tax=Leucobacter chromiisoli TaxID=2796471 RepID=UPI001F462EF6|nr:hypothetical protein [Leucobacter chromiisoli]